MDFRHEPDHVHGQGGVWTGPVVAARGSNAKLFPKLSYSNQFLHRFNSSTDGAQCIKQREGVEKGLDLLRTGTKDFTAQVIHILTNTHLSTHSDSNSVNPRVQD